MARIVITGAAGFIGFHLAQALKDQGHNVMGFDNFNSYYDTELKYNRADILETKNIPVEKIDLQDKPDLFDYLRAEKPEVVIHLAAHAGVRHSMTHQTEYITNNILGTQNLIDVCEKLHINKVVYASTSCVNAGNALPWREDQPAYHQLNPYGYSKRTNECQFMMSKILNTIGLRFFTVYGPWGRPDMALFTFTEKILAGQPIDVYNYGNMKRDFTYVDDIVQGICIVTDRILRNESNSSELYNIGYGEQVDLMNFIAEIQLYTGKEAKMNMLPKHPADTQETWSDTTKLRALGYKPTTSIHEGVGKFINWYTNYYGVNE